MLQHFGFKGRDFLTVGSLHSSSEWTHASPEAPPLGPTCPPGEPSRPSPLATKTPALERASASKMRHASRRRRALMNLIECTYEAHAAPILDILNEAIIHSTALYDYQPRPFASMRGWFDVKARSGHPVLGALDDAGTLLGF